MLFKRKKHLNQYNTVFMRVKAVPPILFLVTLTQASLSYFKIQAVHDFLGVLTIPLIFAYYITEKKSKPDYVYIISLILLFIGDCKMTISFWSDMETAIIFFGTGFFLMCYLVLKRILYIRINHIILVTIPFLILYLWPAIYFADYFKEILLPATIHNLGIGFLIFVIILKLMNEKSFKKNTDLLFSGVFLLGMTVFAAYTIFIEPNAAINSFIVIPCFSLSHYFFARFILDQKR